MTRALSKALTLRGDDASRLLDTMHGEWAEARRQHRPTAGIAERNAMVIRAALEKHVSRRRSLMDSVSLLFRRTWGQA